MQPTSEIGGARIPQRSSENLEQIRKHWSRPIVIDNFITEAEASILRGLAELGEKESVKGFGDFSLHLSFLTHLEKATAFLREKLRGFELASFDFREVNYFKIERPYNVHSDGGKDKEEVPYKNLVIWLDAHQNSGGLVLFKQYTHFSFSLSNSYQDNYNFLMNGSQPEWIENYSPNAIISESDRKNFLAHVPDKDVKGLEIDLAVPYQQYRAVLFDSCQLHTTASSPATGAWKEGIMASLRVHAEEPN